MWGDPGVTELLQLAENPVSVPALTGGQRSVTMSRAGFLRKLRFLMKSNINVSAYTSGSQKSVYGPLAAINNLSVKANGQIDLINISGYGAAIFNEIQNRDGSVLSRPLNISELNVGDSLKLGSYDAISATGDKAAQYPFEFNFAIPVTIRGKLEEIGLWMLQNQAIDVSLQVTFNPLYATVASNDAVWSGGTLTAAMLTTSQLEVERELYDVPNDPKDFPRLDWAHQVIEYVVPFTGSLMRFNIPRSGLILRIAIVNLDDNGAPVEYSDVSSLSWIYGANRSPIVRTGDKVVGEYLQDYNRQPPKGVLVLDFYKGGGEGLKLVKDSEVIANLRLEERFASTTSGTVKVIIDRLYPVGVAV
jgi:hypothetical protein